MYHQHSVLLGHDNAILAVGTVPAEHAIGGAAPELEAVPRLPVGVPAPAGPGVVYLLPGSHIEPLRVQELFTLPAAFIGDKLDKPRHLLDGDGHARAAHLHAVGHLDAVYLPHPQGLEQAGL